MAEFLHHAYVEITVELSGLVIVDSDRGNKYNISITSSRAISLEMPRVMYILMDGKVI